MCNLSKVVNVIIIFLTIEFVQLFLGGGDIIVVFYAK